jgi:hypothetical protein
MTDAYKIGVSVVLTNLIGTELTRIAKEFEVADKSAAGFSVALGAVAVAVAGVTAAMVAGINEARKFQVEVAKFALFGMSDKTNRDAQSFAENMKVIGTSATEAMRLVNEAQGVFRESGLSEDQALRGAKMSAPLLAKIDFISKALDEASASKMHGSAQAMLRFIDMQGGLNDPERFNQIANAGFKAIRSSGGNIDWEQYRQFRARGASAAANLSDAALFGEFEPIIQELKGSTAGFALRTAYNRMNGIIRLPNQAAHELVKIGAWDQSQIEWNSLGGIKRFKGNPLVEADLFAKDPVAYYEKYILPFYEKNHLTQEQRTRENALLFGSTGGNLFSIIERQGGAIHRSADAWNKALGIDASVDVAKKTVDGQLVNLTAEWATLMKNIGTDLLPAVNSGLQILSGILKAINDNWQKIGNTLSFIGKGLHGGDFGAWAANGALDLLGVGSAAPPPKQQSFTLNNVTKLDGRVLADSTTKYQVEGLAKMPSTGNDYDLRATPYMPGYGALGSY